MHDWMLEMYLLNCETYGWKPSFSGARAYKHTWHKAKVVEMFIKNPLAAATGSGETKIFYAYYGAKGRFCK